MMRKPSAFLVCVFVAALVSVAPAPAAPRAAGSSDTWVATWAAAPQLTEPANLPPAPGFADATLRQVAHVSIGGQRIRIRFSNAFGRTALTLQAARVARAAGGSATLAATDRALTFQGRPSVTIPEGALILSDPLDFDLPPLSDLAVTVRLAGAPADVTGHPGSRTTSYLQAGDAIAAADLAAAVRVEHWYFLSGIEVVAAPSAGAVAILGDSITDGRGSTTDGNDRWPDNLARRLQSAGPTKQVAVLNLGIGGNRLLRDGLGPNALARLDRDVLAQPGVRWLIVFEGINDIGTASEARAKGEPAATAEEIIGAHEQIIERAHALGIRVYGATIMPFEGFAYSNYFTPEGEAARRKVNEWIRTSRRFDAVIDFDAVTRDSEQPARLSATVDGGDHLHPSAAGYRIMADAIDLALFTLRPGPEFTRHHAERRRSLNRNRPRSVLPLFVANGKTIKRLPDGLPRRERAQYGDNLLGSLLGSFQGSPRLSFRRAARPAAWAGHLLDVGQCKRKLNPQVVRLVANQGGGCAGSLTRAENAFDDASPCLDFAGAEESVGQEVIGASRRR